MQSFSIPSDYSDSQESEVIEDDLSDDDAQEISNEPLPSSTQLISAVSHSDQESICDCDVCTAFRLSLFQHVQEHGPTQNERNLFDDILAIDKENANPQWAISSSSFIMMIVGIFLLFTVVGANVEITPDFAIIPHNHAFQLKCKSKDEIVGLYHWEHKNFGNVKTYWDTAAILDSTLYFSNFSFPNQGSYTCGRWRDGQALDSWAGATLMVEVLPSDCECKKIHLRNAKLSIICRITDFQTDQIPQWDINNVTLSWQHSFTSKPRLAENGRVFRSKLFAEPVVALMNFQKWTNRRQLKDFSPDIQYYLYNEPSVVRHLNAKQLKPTQVQMPKYWPYRADLHIGVTHLTINLPIEINQIIRMNYGSCRYENQIQAILNDTRSFTDDGSRLQISGMVIILPFLLPLAKI